MCVASAPPVRSAPARLVTAAVVSALLATFGASACGVERAGSPSSGEAAAVADPVPAPSAPSPVDASAATVALDAASDADDAAPLDASAYVARELAALGARTLHDPPALAEVASLVRGGLPKPPDPRAAKAHATLMAWGQDALTLGFLAATAPDPAAARDDAAKLEAMLARWVAYGADFGDPKDVTNYGNASLELTWFMGNMARAARLLDGRPAPDGGAGGAWPAAERAAFVRWAKAIEATYLDFGAFAAGLSNRKASQIETMMRIAELDGPSGEARVGALFGSLRDLVTAAIVDRGDIPEDSGRDKYHPQFFLASALQALAIGERHGLRLHADVAADAVAVARLTAALRYSAETNATDAAPPDYPAMSNPVANHEIPFWILAPAFHAERGAALPQREAFMLAKNYEKPASFGFVMQWGFNAIAQARGL